MNKYQEPVEVSSRFYVYSLSAPERAKDRVEMVIRAGSEIPPGGQQLARSFSTLENAENWAREIVDSFQFAGMIVLYEEEAVF
jgi:hypothetical protein